MILYKKLIKNRLTLSEIINDCYSETLAITERTGNKVPVCYDTPVSTDIYIDFCYYSYGIVVKLLKYLKKKYNNITYHIPYILLTT